jgi:hypothetical protein
MNNRILLWRADRSVPPLGRVAPGEGHRTGYRCLGGAPGARTQNPRIKSPLLYRSYESGSVLTCACEPARHPLNPGELQPELQPGADGRDGGAQSAGAGAGVAAGWQAGRSWRAGPGGGAVMRESGAIPDGPACTRQCTPAGACRTPAAHPGMRAYLAMGQAGLSGSRPSRSRTMRTAGSYCRCAVAGQLGAVSFSLAMVAEGPGPSAFSRGIRVSSSGAPSWR